MWKEHSDICKSDLHVPWTNNVVTSGPMNIHSIIIPTFNISLALGTQGSFIWEPGWGPLVGFKRLLPFFCLHGHFWDESKISCLLLLQMARNWTPRKKKIGITILSWKKTTSALELEIGKKAKAVKKQQENICFWAERHGLYVHIIGHCLRHKLFRGVPSILPPDVSSKRVHSRQKSRMHIHTPGHQGNGKLFQ